MNKTIGFIGCGNMGTAILNGIVKDRLFEPNQILISDVNEEQVGKLTQTLGVNSGSNLEVSSQDIIVLAVKPIMMEAVLSEIKSSLRPDQIIISIAVGLTISFYRNILGHATKLIRVMPNTPVAVNEGMSVLCFQEPTQPDDAQVVQQIFNAIGKTKIVDESLMDVVSALSGSGPALVDIFIEALADGAVRYGLPRQTAYELAAQTLLGSAKLLLETAQHPGVLKDQVCSPGGTTIEAVATLEKHGFRYAIIDAVSTCVEKAKKI